MRTRAARALLAVAVAAGACSPYARAVAPEGHPDVRGYLARPDRAPARDETVDTAPSVLWRARVGRGTLGLPAMGASITVIATVDRWLYAIDTRSGKTRWRRRSDAPFGAGPLVVDGMVFTAGEGALGRVSAWRMSDGRRLWNRRLGDDLSAALTYANGNVYGASSSGVAFGVRAADGTVLWRREIGPTRASPVVLGDRVAFVTITDTLATLDAARGTLLQRATLPTSTVAAPTPLDDSTLVLADPAGGLLAVTVPSGRVQWRVATGAPILGPAVLARDTVFALATTCTLWRVPVDRPAAADSLSIPDCVTQAAPTVLRDGVLVASVRGELILFDPRTRRRVFTRAVRGPLEQPPVVLGGQIIVAPSVGEVVSFR